MSDVVVVSQPARSSLEDLAALAEPVLAAAGAERAVAFGSYARGQADGFADLDLAVVIATDLPPLERGELLAGLYEALPVALDLLVYTPEEFSKGLKKGLGVFDAIAREGVTVYARCEA